MNQEISNEDFFFFLKDGITTGSGHLRKALSPGLEPSFEGLTSILKPGETQGNSSKGTSSLWAGSKLRRPCLLSGRLLPPGQELIDFFTHSFGCFVFSVIILCYDDWLRGPQRSKAR